MGSGGSTPGERRSAAALVISMLALFAAIAGGSAIALQGRNTVDSGDIKDGKVKPVDLAQPTYTDVVKNTGIDDFDPPYDPNPCDSGQTAILCGARSNGNDQYYGFEPIGGDFATAAFTRDGFGTVRLRGSVFNGLSGGADDLLIFILPAGYRPPAALEYLVPREQGNGCSGVGCDELYATVRIFPDGRVVAHRGNFYDGIALDAVAFTAG